MKTKKFLLYLDTNIFLDLIRNRRGSGSIELFRDIRRGKYSASTSTFTLLQIIEEEQERIFAEREIVHRKRSFDEVRGRIGQRDLTPVELESIKIILEKEIYKPFVDTEKIEFRYLDDTGWDSAYELLSKLNLSASDAIHLAVADNLGSDVFVTNDSQLKTVASKFFKPSKMMFASPSEIDDRIKTLEKKREHGKKKKYKRVKRDS